MQSLESFEDRKGKMENKTKKSATATSSLDEDLCPVIGNISTYPVRKQGKKDPEKINIPRHMTSEEALKKE